MSSFDVLKRLYGPEQTGTILRHEIVSGFCFWIIRPDPEYESVDVMVDRVWHNGSMTWVEPPTSSIPLEGKRVEYRLLPGMNYYGKKDGHGAHTC